MNVSEAELASVLKANFMQPVAHSYRQVCGLHGSLPSEGSGIPRNTGRSFMILNSTLRSAATRCRCASDSAPDFAITGVAGGRSLESTGGTGRNQLGGPSCGPRHDCATGLVSAGTCSAGTISPSTTGSASECLLRRCAT
jgi:hypothetical protein